MTLVDTGADSMTGGRLKRVLPYVKDEDAFCLTYGDGVADVDVAGLIDFHRSAKKLVTLPRPAGRQVRRTRNRSGRAVASFSEKPRGDGRWVSGGYFVLSPEVGRYIDGRRHDLGACSLETLTREGQVAAYKHAGFWQPMDTLHERTCSKICGQGAPPPWKVW